MKNIILLLVALFSGSVFADTTDIRTILVDGVNTIEEVNLSTEKTRTEYRQVPSTCYRTVRTTRCTTRRVCNPNGQCRPRRVCRPVVRTVPYRCMRQVATEVHDYFVETNVRFELAIPATQEMVREQITMKMEGERASVSVQGSKNFFLMLDAQNRTESRENGVKYVDLLYKISLVSAAEAKNALARGIKNVKLSRGVLTFSLGTGFNFSNFAQEIKIFRNRRLGSDTLLLEKFLTANEADIQSTASATNLTVDLNKLGINLPSKMRIILNSQYNIDENKILNRGEIDTSATANWVFR